MNINYNQTLTKLNPESRMGKGKGLFFTKTAFIKPGMILFETDKLTNNVKKKIFNNLKKFI